MTALRLLSYNMHGGVARDGMRNIGRIRDLLMRERIDIAVFQEFDTRPARCGNTDEFEQLTANHPHYLAGPTMRDGDGWFGNLIVSRYPILKSRLHDLETARHLEPRFAVDAVIDTPRESLRVIGTHLSLSLGERWREMRRLLRVMESVEARETHPFILTGDINEWRWMSELIRHINRTMTPLPGGRSFPSRFPLLKLDRAWGGHLKTPARARILDGKAIRPLSDHLPLLIEIDELKEDPHVGGQRS